MLPAPRSYDDALRNCKDAFIKDVWSEHLMSLLEDQGIYSYNNIYIFWYEFGMPVIL